MSIEELLPILVPAVSYVISGVVMILGVIKQIKELVKKNEENKEETTSEISEVKDQLKLAIQENAELRAEIHKLNNAIYKIKED